MPTITIDGVDFGVNRSSYQESYSYLGSYPGWLKTLGQHRDSDDVTGSNFRVALERLKDVEKAFLAEHKDNGSADFPSAVFTESSSHWAVGWSECIIIPPPLRLDTGTSYEWGQGNDEALVQRANDFWFSEFDASYESSTQVQLFNALAEALVAEAIEIHKSLMDYPILDKSDWSALECENADSANMSLDCYRDECEDCADLECECGCHNGRCTVCYTYTHTHGSLREEGAVLVDGRIFCPDCADKQDWSAEDIAEYQKAQARITEAEWAAYMGADEEGVA